MWMQFLDLDLLSAERQWALRDRKRFIADMETTHSRECIILYNREGFRWNSLSVCGWVGGGWSLLWLIQKVLQILHMHCILSIKDVFVLIDKESFLGNSLLKNGWRIHNQKILLNLPLKLCTAHANTGLTFTTDPPQTHTHTFLSFADFIYHPPSPVTHSLLVRLEVSLSAGQITIKEMTKTLLRYG